MTLLIKKQLFTMLIMCVGGIVTGIIINVFSLLIKKYFSKSKVAKSTIGLLEAVVVAYLIGEYSFYCQNGKITFTGGVAFFVGLLLWYKYFCDIISVGEDNEQKGKKTPGV